MSSSPPSPPPGKGYFSVPFVRAQRDEALDQWTSAFTLLDTFETYFDSHVDLLQRKLQKHGDRLKLKAEETFKIKDLKIKELSGELLSENLEREIKNFKVRISTRMTSLSATWQSAKVVRTREKISFFFGVMNVLLSTLIFGIAPQWVHISYTVQGLYLLPLRVYRYKKLDWHYFLFDLCYFVTILNFVFIWIFPSSPSLFIACYCLSNGSLASAVITWRNSLVFHDQDKVTSLFIHIYAPFSFTVIRHFYPVAEERFPALLAVPDLDPIQALLISGGIYTIWQLLYWKFLLVDRREKIESGQRTTSFSFLLNNKRGAIGRMLSAIPPQYREASFMGGQLVYALLTEIPVIFLLYRSSFWSAAFLLLIFSVSVWNGGGFYIEVFGRKFERELEALRKELAESAGRSPGPSTSPGHISRGSSLSDIPPILTTSEPVDLVSNGSHSESSPNEISESKKDS